MALVSRGRRWYLDGIEVACEGCTYELNDGTIGEDELCSGWAGDGNEPVQVEK